MRSCEVKGGASAVMQSIKRARCARARARGGGRGGGAEAVERWCRGGGEAVGWRCTRGGRVVARVVAPLGAALGAALVAVRVRVRVRVRLRVRLRVRVRVRVRVAWSRRQREARPKSSRMRVPSGRKPTFSGCRVVELGLGGG